MADTRFLVITVLCYSIITVVILTVCCCAFWRYKKDSNRSNKSRKGRLSVRRIERSHPTMQAPSTVPADGGREAGEVPQQASAPLQEIKYTTPYLGSSFNAGTYASANPQPVSYLPKTYPPGHGGVYGLSMPAAIQMPFAMKGGLPPSLSRRQSDNSDNDGRIDTYRDTSQYTGDELSDVLSSRGDPIDGHEIV